MSKNTQRYVSAYSAGVQAKKQGLSKSTNPYGNIDKRLHAAWHNGWTNGMTKKEIKNDFASMLLNKVKGFIKKGESNNE